MSQDVQQAPKSFFITSELRPTVGPNLESSPPMAPDASPEEIARRSFDLIDSDERLNLGIADDCFGPEALTPVLMKTDDVQETVLDEEAVLLDLQNGIYYTLNPVGTAVWDLVDGQRTVGEILASVCEQFEVTEDVAVADLLPFVARLADRKLVIHAPGTAVAAG